MIGFLARGANKNVATKTIHSSKTERIQAMLCNQTIIFNYMAFVRILSLHTIIVLLSYYSLKKKI